MDKPIPVILRRESELAQIVRPLLDNARVLRGPTVRELRDLEREIQAASSRARLMVQEAQERVDEIEEEARQRGEKEGFKEWIHEIARAKLEYTRLQEQAEQDMVKLAFHIAQRLIGHAIEVQPEVVRDMVGQALVMARGRSQIVVRVHPRDHQQLQAVRDEYARQLDGVSVYFEADPALERGGCIIETESGRIDARLEIQLEVLREALST